MCKPPTPDEFHEMDQDGKLLTLFDLVARLARRAQLVNRIGPWILIVLIPAGWATMTSKGIARDSRIAALDSSFVNVKQQITVKTAQDSLNNLMTQQKLDAIMKDLDVQHPRR